MNIVAGRRHRMKITDHLKRLCPGKTDPVEIEIKAKFAFLFHDYGFAFSKKDLGNAVDPQGKLLFYGPLYCYSLYNSNLCINILYLAQRQEFNVYLTKCLSFDQACIRAGTEVPDEFTYDLAVFSQYAAQSIAETGAVLGLKI